jgi:hypothetical protein
MPKWQEFSLNSRSAQVILARQSESSSFDENTGECEQLASGKNSPCYDEFDQISHLAPFI